MSTGLVACLVLGIAVDDTIHFLSRFNAEAKKRADEKAGVVFALRTVGVRVTATSVALCLVFMVVVIDGVLDVTVPGETGPIRLTQQKRRYPRIGAQLYRNLSAVLAARLERLTRQVRES